MIRSLRKRPRPDQLKRQHRKSTNSLGRLTYLGLVAFLVIGIINFLFGDFFLLRADGLVVRDRTVIAATYLARVEAVSIDAGQQVNANEQLLQLQSTEMLERLADLSTSMANLTARSVEYKIRSKTISDLLPLAAQRERETERVLGVFNDMLDRKLLTSARYDQALSAKFEAREAFIKLSVEGQAFNDELLALEAARDDASKAFAQLRMHYRDGQVAAPITGSVGAETPSVGRVYRPGETMLSLYSGKPYVLAYLPRRYLFPVEAGQNVSISDGRTTVDGTISQILPLTETAPEEFQNAFRPTDRNQLARISFQSIPPFPLHEKVNVTNTNWLF